MFDAFERQLRGVPFSDQLAKFIIAITAKVHPSTGRGYGPNDGGAS